MIAGAWAPDSASAMQVAHQSQDVGATEGTELSSWHRRSSASPNRVFVDRGIQGSSSQQRLPQATSHERRNSTLPPRTRRCLADTARCAATRKLARTITEAFDANSEDVVYELVGLLIVNYNSREHCVVIRAKKQSFSVGSRAISLSDTVKTLFIMYSVRSRPSKRRWHDEECNFRRWALCATRPSGQSGSPCLSPVLLVSTGFSSCTMAGSASHVKHVRLAHIHHCAWCRSPAPCCEAPFTGPFSGDHQNMFLHLCCPLPRQLQQILEPRAKKKRYHHNYDAKLARGSVGRRQPFSHQNVGSPEKQHCTGHITIMVNYFS